MIVEWLLDLVVQFVQWVMSLFSELALPDWASPTSDLATFIGYGASLGAWVPWATMAAVVGSVLLVYVVGFGVKLARQIIAHVPAFGGAG